MKQVIARITKNEHVAARYYKMRIESRYLARDIKPGQFVQVKCSDMIYPLLRRPLGCHRILKDGIEMLYEVVGKGTEILSKRKKGEFLDIIGPLGNGFNITRNPKPETRNPILVAGGIGVAPLAALAEKLAYSVERIADRKRKKIYVLIGGKTKNHITCENDFKKIGCKVYVSTEDGTKGRKGFVTDLLKTYLSAIRYPLSATIYACGPTEMLKAVAQIAKAKQVPCQVLLEEHMACGIGACLGCPVKVKAKYVVRNTNYEYKMVCKDGPVFDAEEIIW